MKINRNVKDWEEKVVNLGYPIFSFYAVIAEKELSSDKKLPINKTIREMGQFISNSERLRNDAVKKLNEAGLLI